VETVDGVHSLGDTKKKEHANFVRIMSPKIKSIMF